MYRGQERCRRGFGGGKLKLTDNLEEVGTGGKIILKWIFKKIGMGRVLY